MGITEETRRESYENIKGTVAGRQAIVLQELKKCPRLTANELALRLYKQGIIPRPERNFVHPRLTELVEDGRAAVADKRTCTVSGKCCAVYVATG
ncbi:hypothetical protein, partial [Salinithrix halophila]